MGDAMTKKEANALQARYVEQRRVHREAWWAEYVEDFCARKDVNPENGRRVQEPELR